MQRALSAVSLCICLTTLVTGPATAQSTEGISLPQPRLTQGKLLMQALKDRKTMREFDERKLPVEVISDLLWAACGVNRPDSGRRTAPTAHNKQEVDVYVTTTDGLFLYEPKTHSLKKLLSEDVRAATGRQTLVKTAPLTLVYVADLARMNDAEEAQKMILASADSGIVGQNVYLYCASEGLATVFRAGIDREELAGIMKLRPEQKITFAQTVGYPKGGDGK